MDKDPKPTGGVSDVASQGGLARAKSLTPEERKQIARAASEARWEKAGKAPLPKATHEGFLHIGDMEIPCAVLENSKRVLTLSGFMVALGRARQAKGRQYYKGDVNLPVFLTAANLKPFIPPDLDVTSKGIEFKPLTGGGRAYGYAAELLPSVCWTFIDAKTAGVLKANQEHIAEKSMVLVRALTSTSIIALVDEATGFQYDRPRRDLEEQLNKFLSESLRRWVRTFPGDYFKHLCRLRGVELRPDMKLPPYFGTLTNNLVYRRIAPGLLGKLKDRRNERGNASNKLFSWLSEDIGLRELLVHLGQVIGIMKRHTDYDTFVRELDVITPIFPASPGLFDDPEDWVQPE